MAIELRNVQISHISLVDKGANGRTFAIIKAEGDPTIEKQVSILKHDEEKRLVTGVVYEPNVPDSHGEFMTADEIEKTAHQFMKDARNVDLAHNFASGYGEVIESYVAKSDHYVGNQLVKKGSWVASVYVIDDDAWHRIKKGEITSFSMGGFGERVVKSEEEQKSIVAAIVEGIKKVLSTSKSEEDDADNVSSACREEFAAFAAIYNEELSSKAPNFDRLVTAAQKMEAAFLEIEKHGALPKQDEEKRKNAIKTTALEEEIALTEEQLQAVIREALEPIQERLTMLEDKIGAPDETEEIKKEHLTAALRAVMKAEMAPINERIERMERLKGIKKSMYTSGEGQETSVWSGLL